MGARGSGKTSVSAEFDDPNRWCELTCAPQFINMGNGSNLPTGTHLEACTAEVQVANEFTLDGERVLLVDTPGFDDRYEDGTDTLKLVAASLAITWVRFFIR